MVSGRLVSYSGRIALLISFSCLPVYMLFLQRKIHQGNQREGKSSENQKIDKPYPFEYGME